MTRKKYPYVVPTVGKNRVIEKLLQKFHIKYNSLGLRPIPNSVILISLLLSFNTIFHLLLDITIEALSFFSLLPKVPFRIDFLSLTFLSALLATQTLAGLRKKDLELTQSSLIVGFFVEAALIVGDIYFITQNSTTYTFASNLRYLFIFLTFLNALFIVFIILRMRIFKFLRRQS